MLETALKFGAVFFLLGGLAGLVMGLAVYPPTAWFAVLEVGIPTAVVGALIGLVVHLVTRRGRTT